MKIVGWIALVPKVGVAVLMSGVMSHSAYAEGSHRDIDSISPFSKGSAISPYAASPKVAAPKKLEFFPRTNSANDVSFLDEPSLSPVRASGEAAQPVHKFGEGEVETPEAKRERLLAKYGSPEKDAPVLAVNDAPTPFKAMMESLQEGDDELAFQYSKQYVRHLRNVQDRSTRVMSLVGFAQRSEHMIEDNDWKNAPQLEEDKKLYEADLANNAKKSTADIEKEIEATAREVIAKNRAKIEVKPGAVKLEAMAPQKKTVHALGEDVEVTR